MADSRPENEPEQQLPAVEQSTTEQDEALQVDDAAGQVRDSVQTMTSHSS